MDGTNIYSRQGGRLLGVRNGATNLAAGINAHGDVTHLFNPATANVSDTKIFDPFGVPAGATGTTPNRIGYQSGWTDPTTNQVWMGARWYSPANDIFTSRDTSAGELRNHHAHQQKRSSIGIVSSLTNRRTSCVGNFRVDGRDRADRGPAVNLEHAPKPAYGVLAAGTPMFRSTTTRPFLSTVVK